jgi:hypothetical protein
MNKASRAKEPYPIFVGLWLASIQGKTALHKT